jgi:hypothetical protein
MDRESAKQVLITTFGLDKATAEKLVPEEPEPLDTMSTMGNGNGSGGKPKEKKRV